MTNLHGVWVPGVPDQEPAYFAIWRDLPGIDAPDELPFPSRLIHLDHNPHVLQATAVYPAEGNAWQFVDWLLVGSKNGNTDGGGTSLSLWQQAAQLVLRLLAAGHYAPAIASPVAGGSIGGCWDPLLDDPAVSYELNRLAARTGIMGTAIFGVVVNFIQTILELLIREALTPDDRHEMLKRLNPRYSVPMTPVEHWVDSLLKPFGNQYNVSLEWLTDETTAWKRHIAERLERDSLRTCFVLEAPATDNENELNEQLWTIRYKLQSAELPGVDFDARDIWRTSFAEAEIRHFPLRDPQERLLADLERAGRLYSPIEASLSAAAPDCCRIRLSEAYVFMTQHSALLRTHGFEVDLPPWWRSRESRLTMRMHVIAPTAAHLRRNNVSHDMNEASGLLNFSSLVSFDWQVALGDSVLTVDQLNTMENWNGPLVRIDGQWYEWNQAEISRALHFVRGQSGGKVRLSDAVQLALAADRGHADDAHINEWVAELAEERREVPLPISGVTAEGDVGQWLGRLLTADRPATLEQPEPLNGVLRPYQLRGFNWLFGMRGLRIGACLADDMGLGKTIQWIAYLLQVKQSSLQKGPALLICPTSVLNNWHKELERFAPALNVYMHYGPARLTGAEFTEALREFDIVLSSYTTVHRDISMLSAFEWDVVTLDEAQQIKNSEAKMSISIRSLPAFHRIALTGTPVENRLTELWSIMDFLNPGYLGNKENFRTRFTVPIEREQDATSTRTLQQLTRPFVLRRVKTDRSVIEDLPDKHEMKVYCSLTREQVGLYEKCVRGLLNNAGMLHGMSRKGAILAALTHLKQICNHPAHFLGRSEPLPQRSGKLARLLEMADEVLESGERMLVFTQYAAMAELLHESLERKFPGDVLLLHGKVAKAKRDEMVARFQEQPDAPRIFVITLKTGGYGLNLTRASHVFHYDRWWNPAVENQATDRVYRIGQRSNVQVHKFICSGTLEERIDQMIENKRLLAGSIIGGGESWITEMSDDELKMLFALRYDSLIEDED